MKESADKSLHEKIGFSLKKKLRDLFNIIHFSIKNEMMMRGDRVYSDFSELLVRATDLTP